MRPYQPMFKVKKNTKITSVQFEMFSTAGFNEGAVNYALQHGIALVQLASGETLYFTKKWESYSPA